MNLLGSRPRIIDLSAALTYQRIAGTWKCLLADWASNWPESAVFNSEHSRHRTFTVQVQKRDAGCVRCPPRCSSRVFGAAALSRLAACATPYMPWSLSASLSSSAVSLQRGGAGAAEAVKAKRTVRFISAEGEALKEK